MADTIVKFFDPADPIALGGDWELQSVAHSDAKNRSSGLGREGDEAASKLSDAKTSLTLTYKNFKSSGNLTLPKVGSVLGSATKYHIDGIELAYAPNDWPTLTVTAHCHGGSKNHTAGSCRTYTPTVTLPAQSCIPTSIAEAFSMSALGVGMRGLTYSLAVTHVDELDGCGDWLAGENHDGVETINAEFTGVPVGGDLTIESEWDKVGSGYNEANNAADTASLNLTRHVSKDSVGGDGQGGGD